MRILLDENGYIKEWAMCPKGEGHVCLEDGIEIDDIIDASDEESINNFYNEFQSYRIVDDVLVKDDNKMEEIVVERKKDNLRGRRENECFSVINRGAAWYNTLTNEQSIELSVWYKAWLDVTDTMVVPECPEWIAVAQH